MVVVGCGFVVVVVGAGAVAGGSWIVENENKVGSGMIAIGMIEWVLNSWVELFGVDDILIGLLFVESN